MTPTATADPGPAGPPHRPGERREPARSHPGSDQRPHWHFTRQVFLGETLDADHICADYSAGVLTLTIPVREAAKPRSIQVTSRDHEQAVTA
jgi:HSP20 family protein